MKANKKLSELRLEELIEKKKKLQGIVIGLGIVMFITSIGIIYFAIKNNNYTSMVIVISCFVTLLPNVVSLSQLNAEIKSRKW